MDHIPRMVAGECRNDTTSAHSRGFDVEKVVLPPPQTAYSQIFIRGAGGGSGVRPLPIQRPPSQRSDPKEPDALVWIKSQRRLSMIVMPNYGVPINSKTFTDGELVQSHHIRNACSQVIFTIAELYDKGMQLSSNPITLDGVKERPFPTLHRDISIQNILLRRRSNGAVHATLIDFDFAAHRIEAGIDNPSLESAATSHPSPTGTLQFMACDIVGLFRAPFHRPYFDMESVFWVLVSVVLEPFDNPHIQRTLASLADPEKQAYKGSSILPDLDVGSEIADIIQEQNADTNHLWSTICKMKAYLLHWVPDPELPTPFSKYTQERFLRGKHAHSARPSWKPWSDDCELVNNTALCLGRILRLED